MSGLAWTLRSQGQYEKSEKMHQQTLILIEKVLGKEHPHTLDSMSGLAWNWGSQDQYEESEKMHQQTLRLRVLRLLIFATILVRTATR
jgi:hypothetical protein